jgi:multiple sugar transport system permease protein
MEGAETMGALLSSRARPSPRPRLAKLGITALMLAIALAMVLPFVLMISASFKYSAEAFEDPLRLIPKRINWNNYGEIFRHKYYFRWFLNSGLTAMAIILLKTTVVSMVAYAFAKLHFRGRDTLFVILMSAMMITPDSTIVARYLQYSYMGLINSLWVLILPALFGVYFVFLLRQFFMGIPNELSEAALMDGASHLGIYSRIIIPLSKPALLTMVLFSFIWSWNDYINPFVFITPVTTQVLTVGLQSFQTEYSVDTSLQMAGVCISLLPVLLIFILVQDYFVEGIASTGIKG